MAIALCQQKYNIQAIGIIPAVEMPVHLPTLILNH